MCVSVCESVFTHVLKPKQLVFDLEPLPAFFHLFGFTLKNDGSRACVTSLLNSDDKTFFSALIKSFRNI